MIFLIVVKEEEEDRMAELEEEEEEKKKKVKVVVEDRRPRMPQYIPASNHNPNMLAYPPPPKPEDFISPLDLAEVEEEEEKVPADQHPTDSFAGSGSPLHLCVI